MARGLGYDDETLQALDDLDRISLPDREKAALRFAEKMTHDHEGITAGDIDLLREHFDEDQIVEIACVVGAFNYLNRFADALGLWPTREGEGGPDDRD